MGNPWDRAIARALNEPNSKARLVADPVKTLREAGVPLPHGLAIKIHENTEREVHMVLPGFPAAELSDIQLERIAAGLHRPSGEKGCGAQPLV